jgi:5-(carboxyamino)imidazole ribonucleotide mutase
MSQDQAGDRHDVIIAMGSESDWPTLQHAADMLDELGLSWRAEVCSAHRTPARAAELATTAHERGTKVLIAAAGGAAHLAGVLAAHTVLPVIGVPVTGWALDGLDSLLSTVQMPRGVPVATVAIGKAGAVNAAILAAQILALSSPELRDRLLQQRAFQAEKIAEANQRLQREAGGA